MSSVPPVCMCPISALPKRYSVPPKRCGCDVTPTQDITSLSKCSIDVISQASTSLSMPGRREWIHKCGGRTFCTFHLVEEPELRTATVRYQDFSPMQSRFLQPQSRFIIQCRPGI